MPQTTEAKPTAVDAITVDADGHVLEPRDTWKNYLEPQYRDRAICIEEDAKGSEVLLVDGKPVEILRHQLAALGGIELDPDEAFGNRDLTYEDGCPAGSYEPKARLEVMDQEGIDVSILYPTIGICWEGPLQDGELAAAYTRAYNRWIADFCRHDPKRLIPAAHISLLDPERAVAELERPARTAAGASSCPPTGRPAPVATSTTRASIAFGPQPRISGCPWAFT